jgi:hypothetical protein
MPRRWLKLLDKWESYIVPETAGFQFDVILLPTAEFTSLHCEIKDLNVCAIYFTWFFFLVN